ncbi:hypothetical protein H6503_05585 [Candidatus Woesearchaeota archaeon]|nr:hypothetical protein [Candidatus Woesearchaeota archaeon]
MAVPKKVKKKLKLFGFYSLIVFLVLIILMLFNVPVGKIILIAIMMGIATVSKLYKHFIGISIGFELITPVVIIFAYTLNPLFTIVAAVLMVVVSEFISGQVYTNNMIAQIIIYVFIVFFVFVFKSFGFIGLANSMIVLRNVALWLSMVIPGFVDPIRATIATLPNIFINGFIVSTLGVVLVNVLA